MSKKFCIRFGQYIFALYFDKQETIDFVKSHFNEHLAESPPNISIFIAESPPVTSSFIPGDRYRHFIDNEKFNFGPDLLVGSWDERNRQCHLLISKSLLKTEEIWLFNQFLCCLYYTHFLKESSVLKDVLIIHSSGIKKEGQGYVFFGPAGSGKSTVAHLSREYDILHDDMNLITIQENNVMTEGVPYNPKRLELSHAKASLSMILSLQKGEQVKIEKGTPQEFVKKVLPEVFLPMPILSEDRKSAYQYSLHCIKKMSETVPYYCLYFKKDENFWDLINKMEEDNGEHTEVLYQEK